MAAALALMMASVVGAVIVMTMRQVSAQAQDRAAAQLSAAQTLFHSHIERRSASGLAMARLVTQLPVFRAHLTDPQLATHRPTLDAMLEGYRVEVLPEALVWYRQSPNGVNSTTPPAANHLRALRPYRRAFGDGLVNTLQLCARPGRDGSGPARQALPVDHVRDVVIFGAAQGGQRAVELASRCGWRVAYIVDNNQAAWNTTAHGVTVPRASERWMKLTCWVSHPDADANPVEVRVWRNRERIVDRRLRRGQRMVQYVEVPGENKRFVLEVKVDRTWRPADHGQADPRELGLGMQWEFVERPPQ